MFSRYIRLFVLAFAAFQIPNLLLPILLSHAQADSGRGELPVDDPGDGAIVLNVSVHADGEADTIIPIRDSTGTKVGTFLFTRATEARQYMEPNTAIVHGKTISLSKIDWVYFAYEFRTLTYYDKKDGKLRILNSNFPKGLWIDTKDIRSKYKVFNWVELFAVVPFGQWNGFDSYRVRAKPNTDANVLVKLREQNLWPNKSHQVLPTGKILGSWAQVRVQTYKGAHGEPGIDESPLGKPIVGWIKIANEDGVVTDIFQSIP